jgi:glycosyltransferase involved in cell wall biosynthesis
VSNIKIAVVVPVGKINDDFIDCYESILKQTHKPDKVIIVFDTVSQNICNEIVLHSNTIFVSTLTRGQANARNVGIEIAHDCNFIATMDSDDLMHINRIEVSTQSVIEHPGLDVYCFASDYIDSKGQPIEFSLGYNSILEGEEFLEKFFKRNLIINSTSIIRKSAFNEVGMYENISKMVDYYLWLKFISMDKRFIYLPNVVIKSRIHHNQLSHQRISKRLILEVLLLRIKAAQTLRWNPIYLFVNNLIWFLGKLVTEAGLRKSRVKRVLNSLERSA